ncbi:MAG: phosphatase PAP2 family protein [Sphingomonas sp.]|nr:phosphatase PAP2 family protein [Sphingomonas sp.]
MIDNLKNSASQLWQARRSELTILSILIAFCVAITLFLKFASEVTEGDTLYLDRLIIVSLRQPGDPSLPIGPPWLTTFMADITSLGSASVLVTVTLVVLGYLLTRRHAERAILTFVAVSLGYALSTTLKSIFSRPRPDIVTHLVNVTSASFPSGHAMNSAVVYLTLAALLAQAERDKRARVYILACGLSLTGLVGISRVYLGVHWPTDVMAGWAVGAIWALFCLLAAYGLRRYRSGHFVGR